jgi:glycosyltransferase 2 family protein
LLIGVGVLAFLLWRYNLRSTLGTIERERIGFFIATVMLYVAGQVMSAFRWQLLARLAGVGGGYLEYLSFYFIGMFTNVFVPGLIGGDALRALYLRQRHGGIAGPIASVVADRGVGFVALLWFAAGSALLVREVPLPAGVFQITVVAGGASMLGWLVAPFIAGWLKCLPGRLGRVLAPVIPYISNPGALLPAIILSLVLQGSLAACQYLLAVGIGLKISLATFILIVPIANVLASLPVTINGLGLREAAYMVLLGLAGASKDQAVALSLLYFGATLIGNLTGLIPFIATPMPSPEPASD